jgi:hypothetical protein
MVPNGTEVHGQRTLSLLGGPEVWGFRAAGGEAMRAERSVSEASLTERSVRTMEPEVEKRRDAQSRQTSCVSAIRYSFAWAS